MVGKYESEIIRRATNCAFTIMNLTKGVVDRTVGCQTYMGGLCNPINPVLLGNSGIYQENIGSARTNTVYGR